MIILTFILLGIVLTFWCLSKLHIPYTSQMLVILLILVMGLRYDVGRDYPTYEIIYENPYSYAALAIEPIWKIVNNILRFCGFQSQAFFFLTSLIILVCYYKGIKRLSPYFYLSIFLFIIAGFYFESANIVRQYVAMSLLFCGFIDFVEKRWLQYSLWVIIAAMFHISVLLVFPLIFLSNYRYSTWMLCSIWTVSLFCGGYLLNLIVKYLLPILGEIGSYSYAIDDFDSGVTSGMLKIFYNLLALFVLVLYSKYSFRDRLIYVLTNMFLFGVIIYNLCYIFMPARRLYLYFFPYFIVLFPYCFLYFKKASRWIVISIISLIYLAFILKSNVGIQYNFNYNFF